jgi:preprotein translocase subunit YajC
MEIITVGGSTSTVTKIVDENGLEYELETKAELDILKEIFEKMTILIEVVKEIQEEVDNK